MNSIDLHVLTCINISEFKSLDARHSAATCGSLQHSVAVGLGPDSISCLGLGSSSLAACPNCLLEGVLAAAAGVSQYFISSNFDRFSRVHSIHALHGFPWFQMYSYGLYDNSVIQEFGCLGCGRMWQAVTESCDPYTVP